MSTYILVHGSWHGAWCWNKVVPLLEQAGHKVVTLDLPARGQDTTPIPEVTLMSCVTRIVEHIDAESEPVILVGHSMAGMLITQAAEFRPQSIQRLVYLCAFLPQNGESLLMLAGNDSNSKATPNFIVNEAEGYVDISSDMIKEVFYNDCSDEDVEWAKSLLVHEPLAPLAAPVSTSEGSFGQVYRVYIECAHDNAITITQQRRMNTALPCQMFTMQTSHSPFISAPQELADILATLL